jgi:hypothetical protein
MIYQLLKPALSLLVFLLLGIGATLGQQQPQQPASQTAPDSSSRTAGKTAGGASSHSATPVAPPSATAPAESASDSSTPAPRHVIVASSSDMIGTLSSANLYTNPALGLMLQLTGEWQFMDAETRRMAEGRPAENDPAAREREAQRRSQCTGPLCGEPAIDVALFTELNPTVATSSVFIAGFRLAPPYLDRKQYPLKWFAEIMLPRSASDVGFQAADNLSEVQLGGRPAYRLLVRNPGEQQSREVGYIVESNGYMVLLVASTSEPADLPKLREQMEGVKFAKPAAAN